MGTCVAPVLDPLWDEGRQLWRFLFELSSTWQYNTCQDDPHAWYIVSSWDGAPAFSHQYLWSLLIFLIFSIYFDIRYTCICRRCAQVPGAIADALADKFPTMSAGGWKRRSLTEWTCGKMTQIYNYIMDCESFCGSFGKCLLLFSEPAHSIDVALCVQALCNVWVFFSVLLPNDVVIRFLHTCTLLSLERSFYIVTQRAIQEVMEVDFVLDKKLAGVGAGHVSFSDPFHDSI